MFVFNLFRSTFFWVDSLFVVFWIWHKFEFVVIQIKMKWRGFNDLRLAMILNRIQYNFVKRYLTDSFHFEFPAFCLVFYILAVWCFIKIRAYIKKSRSENLRLGISYTVASTKNPDFHIYWRMKCTRYDKFDVCWQI